MAKPNIVLFTGAFHPETCVSGLIDKLRAAGFPSEAHALPSAGTLGATVADDEARMRSVLAVHIDAGRDVLFVVHSFAGFPGAAALSGLSKHEHESYGQRGGIVGVIYLAAFVPLAGDTVYKLLQNKWEPWMVPKEDDGFIFTQDEANTFYNDCDADVAAKTTATLKGHSVKALRGDGGVPRAIGWRDEGYDGRRAYIQCQRDNALPLPVQEMFTQRSGVEWVIKKLDASHSPYLSMPEATARTIEEINTAFYAA